MIYVVIPVFNRWHFTEACLRSLLQQDYPHYKIVLVDHGSTDATSQNVEMYFPEVKILKGDASMWWTAAVNLGIKFSIQENADFVLTLNNDLIVPKNYLSSLIEVNSIKSKTIWGSVVIDSQNHENVVFAGVFWNQFTAKYNLRGPIEILRTQGRNHRYIETDLLPGRGMLIPVQAFDEIGLFDELNFPHYQADEEFSIRCKRNGYCLAISTHSMLYCEIKENGLNEINRKSSFEKWSDLLFSMKSPVNIKRRWLWAWNVTPIPLLYFLIDFFRILVSQLTGRKH